VVRINKYLASCGLGSRRSVEELIRSGRVSVNGVLCTNLATEINEATDDVKVSKKTVKPAEQKIFIMLHKPCGYIVTHSDEFHRKTVYDLLPDFAKDLHPIGRLDSDSEGLLILTNDGNVTNAVTHPSYKMEKIYKVVVKGLVTKDDVRKLRNGVFLEDIKTQTAKVFLKKTSTEQSELRIGITEGKNRQIRRMLESIGHEVVLLKRLQIGDIKLEKLPVGNWRFLNDREILFLLRLSPSVNIG